MSDRWAYSLDGVVYGDDTYPSREAAFAAATDEAGRRGRDTIWVGRCRFHHPEIDADQIVDYLLGCADCECGEASELWMDGLTDDQVDELGVMIQRALDEWLEMTGNVPRFFIVESPEKVAWDG